MRSNATSEICCMSMQGTQFIATLGYGDVDPRPQGPYPHAVPSGTYSVQCIVNAELLPAGFGDCPGN